MINTDFLDNLVRQVMQTLPGGDGQLTKDLEKNLRAAMQGVFNRMDLVTREEFELQTELLARTRTKLEQLEQQVAELEAQLKNSS
ncbi:MAG TPA: accessory factor UbiK family protein [Gammaproteobacteria bacterium]|nr:accessory factor UbiK family protein [Gammaproteobacteria bacterium]